MTTIVHRVAPDGGGSIIMGGAGSPVDERIDLQLFHELQRAVTLALVGWLALAVLAVVLVTLDAWRARRRARFRARHNIHG